MPSPSSCRCRPRTPRTSQRLLGDLREVPARAALVVRRGRAHRPQRALPRRRDRAREAVPPDRRRAALHLDGGDRQVRGRAEPQASAWCASPRPSSSSATATRRMVIGEGGERLKRIGTEARQELEKLLDAQGVPRAVGQGALRLGRRRSAGALASATSSATLPPPAWRTRERMRRDEPAFVLHRYDWSESSLILEVFTRHQGRIAVVAKGAKRPSLAICARCCCRSSRCTSRSARDAENRARCRLARRMGRRAGRCRPATRCFRGYYLNELLMRCWPATTRIRALFDAYAATVRVLGVASTARRCSRRCARSSWCCCARSACCPTLDRQTADASAAAPGRPLLPARRSRRCRGATTTPARSSTRRAGCGCRRRSTTRRLRTRSPQACAPHCPSSSRSCAHCCTTIAASSHAAHAPADDRTAEPYEPHSHDRSPPTTQRRCSRQPQQGGAAAQHRAARHPDPLRAALLPGGRRPRHHRAPAPRTRHIRADDVRDAARLAARTGRRPSSTSKAIRSTT